MAPTSPNPDLPAIWGRDVIQVVTADIIAHQVLLNRVPEQATEDRVRYQIYY